MRPIKVKNYKNESFYLNRNNNEDIDLDGATDDELRAYIKKLQKRNI